jgi:hypothetical protein
MTDIQTTTPARENKIHSPLQTLGVFTVAAFASELLIMLFLNFTGIKGPFSHVIDAALLTLLILPLMIFLVYKPLISDAALQQKAKNEMKASHDILLTVLDSLEAIVYATDIKTNELLFLNKFAKEIFGDSIGKTCWQVLQKGQTAPCEFCSNDKLLSEEGEILGGYSWEFQNTVTNNWYDIRDRAIHWIDGRLVRLEIATDITQRKHSEIERGKMISELEKTLAEVNFLKGIVPICSHCKKIRDDEGFWKQVDEYVAKHTGAQFSHGICPTCMHENFPEYEE